MEVFIKILNSRGTPIGQLSFYPSVGVMGSAVSPESEDLVTRIVEHVNNTKMLSPDGRSEITPVLENEHAYMQKAFFVARDYFIDIRDFDTTVDIVRLTE